MRYLRWYGYETRFDEEQDAEPNMIGAEYRGRGTHIEVGCEAITASVDICENIFGEIESITVKVVNEGESEEVYLSKGVARFLVKAIQKFLADREEGTERVELVEIC